MRTHLTVSQIKDYIIDTIIIKSKLISQKSDLDELLKKSNLSFASDLLKSDSRTIGFRPEELQELINEIRRNIGDVDDRDGLVITNFILCINDEYEYWVEVIRFEQDNVVLAGG